MSSGYMRFSPARAGIAKERLGNGAAYHPGDGGQKTAGHHAAHSHAATIHAAESALHRARSANFGARCQAGQGLRIIFPRHSCRGTFCIRDAGGQLLQKHRALLRRELCKRFSMRLLDGLRRRDVEHVAIADDRLLISSLSPVCARALCRVRLRLRPCRQQTSGSDVNLPAIREIGQGQESGPQSFAGASRPAADRLKRTPVSAATPVKAALSDPAILLPPARSPSPPQTPLP